MAALLVLVVMIPVWAKVVLAFSAFALIVCWAVVTWVEGFDRRNGR